MVGAGVPLIRSLNSLEQHSESAGLKAVLVEVIKDIEAVPHLATRSQSCKNLQRCLYQYGARR